MELKRGHLAIGAVAAAAGGGFISHIVTGGITPVHENTNQIYLLVAVLCNTFLQVWQSRQQRIDAERQKNEVKAELATKAQQIQDAYRTRITDLNSSLDGIITAEDFPKRRKDD